MLRRNYGQKETTRHHKGAIVAYKQGDFVLVKDILYKSCIVDPAPAGEQELYSLVVEFYLFVCGGNLKESGRDFGYDSIAEIEKDLEKFI